MQTSITNSAISTTPIKGAPTGNNPAKYLKINNKMCPAARLVAKRTTKIRGRSIIDTNSTIGRSTIIQIGAPFGNICAKNPLKSVKVAQITIGVQMISLTVITVE